MLKDSIEKCVVQKRAIVSFNVQNLYHLVALSKISSQHKVPVIAQVSKRYISTFDSLIGLENLVHRFRSDYLTFHLDHCNDFKVIEKCIDSGFSSVMFDGSALPLQENIEGTNFVFDKAAKVGCLVEAELGAIGGVEDGEGVEHTDVFSMDDLKEFAAKANYSMLALAIGNAHGHYTSTSGIKIQLLKDAVMEVGETPLVLHGATGLPDDMINQSIDYGVIKINVSTALKSKTSEVIRQFSSQNPEYNESSFLDFVSKEFGSFYYDFIKKFTI